MPNDIVFTGKQYAVIGDPIGHTLSPVMHNAAFRALGMNARYFPVHVLRNDLEAFVRSAKKHLAGFNITVPHKNAILPFLDRISEHARLAKSVNTVTVEEDGSLSGDSTDGYGFETAVKEAGGPAFSGASFCFLGCGGVVPALAYHAAFAGAASIAIANRTPEKASALCDALKTRFPALRCEYAALADARDLLKHAVFTVQCTSLGLKEDDPAPIPPEMLSPDTFYFDTIYRETKLFHHAKEHGLPCANGTGMLLHQGARSFTIWTHADAPVAVMREALKNSASCGK